MPAAAARTKAERDRRDALQGRLFNAFIASMELQTVHLGRQLGFYQALAAAGPATSRQLAKRTGCDERYAREWLEQQAVAGMLDVASGTDAASRAYALPAGFHHVLLDAASPRFVGFTAQMSAALGKQVDKLVAAYRSGDGVPWGAYGADMRLAQADQNKAFLLTAFAEQFLRKVPGLHRRLSQRKSRIADLACGVGWAGLAIAKAYPKATVDGLDLDKQAIRTARENAKAMKLDGRVTFQARDAASPELAGQYDLVVMVEALHDLSQPVKVLRAARKLLAPGGRMLVVDENVAEEFAAPGPDLERAFYGFSVLGCLPNGRADSPSAATGTVMRPATVAKYGKDAGFQAIDVVPAGHDFFRLYELRP